MGDLDLEGDPECAWLAVSHAGWDFVIEGYHACGTVTVRGDELDDPRLVFTAATAKDAVMSLLLRVNCLSGPAPLAPAPLAVKQPRSLFSPVRRAMIGLAAVIALVALPTVEHYVMPDVQDAPDVQAS